MSLNRVLAQRGVLLAFLVLMMLTPTGAVGVPICAGTGHCYDTNGGQGLGANTWTGAAVAAGTVSFNGHAGHLLTVTSLAESQVIAANFPGVSAQHHWIGLFQVAGVEPGSPAQGAAGGWAWVTGEPFYQSNTNTAADVIFQNWGFMQPDNSGPFGPENFGEFNTPLNAAGFAWNDEASVLSKAYLIEFEPVPEPATLLLFGTTAAGLGLARWRQRRGKHVVPTE